MGHTFPLWSNRQVQPASEFFCGVGKASVDRAEVDDFFLLLIMVVGLGLES